ncbi:MAG: GIY-YIG nuclease family protein [Anaeromyxobacter sp.]
MSTDRAALKRQYREAKEPMGVFVIRNLRNGRFQVRQALNLRGGMNRLKVEITPGTNPNVALRDDWRAMGPEAFEVKVLDVLEPPKDAAPSWDPKDDLAALERMWIDRLKAEGGVPY